MAIENIFKQKKYPFVLALSVLLVTVTLFVLTTTTNPISSVFFYQQQSSGNSTVSRTAAFGPSAAENNNTNRDSNNNNTPSPTKNDNSNSDNNNNNDNNENKSSSGNNDSNSSSGNNDKNNNNNGVVVASDSNNNSNTNGGAVFGSDSNDNNTNNEATTNDNNNDDATTNDNINDDATTNDNNNNSDATTTTNNNNNDATTTTNNNNDATINNNNNDATINNNNNDATINNNNNDATNNKNNDATNNNNSGVVWSETETDSTQWELCNWPLAADYIPCLDNNDAIKKLKSRAHMEHRERHCPNPPPRCLVPFPDGYKMPIPWPKSRDMIWFNNVPHPKLVEYKKGQNWVRQSGEYFVFPGGGTQFKDGVTKYIDFIQRTFSPVNWGKDIRVVLDVGCGVASFGGYLLDKNTITMSFAPKDEHEAQIQFALERGIPAILSVIGTKKLPFPDDSYDLIHCARCRVHWDADGGKPLLELNRILRPGGFFVWSATPVYRKDERHQNIWQSMSNLTQSICWKAVARGMDSSRIGLVIFQKPMTYSCYKKRKQNDPPLCNTKFGYNSSWYVPLPRCVSELPLDRNDVVASWPKSWPERLHLPGVTNEKREMRGIKKNSKYWSEIVSNIYLKDLPINWTRVRNVMDMNATYGGFAAALIEKQVWVMNVMPIDTKDALPSIFDRGLIGIYHDWCESFSTYPRTYDLLHSSYLLSSAARRCDIKDVIVEIDRILRPDGYLIVQDSMEMIDKVSPILRSLHWSVKLYQNQFLLGIKGFWRP